MIFVLEGKNNVLVLRYLIFVIFGELIDFKVIVCDAIIGIILHIRWCTFDCFSRIMGRVSMKLSQVLEQLITFISNLLLALLKSSLWFRKTDNIIRSVNLYTIQSNVVDSQIDPNSIQKNIYCSKLFQRFYFYFLSFYFQSFLFIAPVFQSFYCLGWNIIDRFVYFMIYIHIITLLSHALMKVFIYVLLNCSKLYLSIN